MVNKNSNLIKTASKSILKSAVGQVPILGNVFSVIDDTFAAIENENLKCKVDELDQSDGILEEISGVTFYLNDKIHNKNKVIELSKLLNDNLKEYINLDCMSECTIDDVIVSDNTISINFTDTVEKYYIDDGTDSIKDEILGYFEQAEINSIYIVKKKYY